jgi:hypothetical protein
MQVADLSPPNSLLLIMDRSVGQIPEWVSDKLVVFTSTCIAIGTLAECDGGTRVTLCNTSGTQVRSPTFEVVLQTPSRKIAVCSVLNEVFLEVLVGTEQTRIRIWANHPSEPNEIHIEAF